MFMHATYFIIIPIAHHLYRKAVTISNKKNSEHLQSWAKYLLYKTQFDFVWGITINYKRNVAVKYASIAYVCVSDAFQLVKPFFSVQQWRNSSSSLCFFAFFPAWALWNSARLRTSWGHGENVNFKNRWLPRNREKLLQKLTLLAPITISLVSCHVRFLISSTEWRNHRIIRAA